MKFPKHQYKPTIDLSNISTKELKEELAKRIEPGTFTFTFWWDKKGKFHSTKPKLVKQ